MHFATVFSCLTNKKNEKTQQSKKKARAEAAAVVAKSKGVSKAKAKAKAMKVKAIPKADPKGKRQAPRPGGKQKGSGPGVPKQSAQSVKPKKGGGGGGFQVGVKGAPAATDGRRRGQKGLGGGQTVIVPVRIPVELGGVGEGGWAGKGEEDVRWTGEMV